MFISFDGFWLTVLAKSGENILPILQKNVRTNFVKNAYLNQGSKFRHPDVGSVNPPVNKILARPGRWSGRRPADEEKISGGQACVNV